MKIIILSISILSIASAHADGFNHNASALLNALKSEPISKENCQTRSKDFYEKFNNFDYKSFQVEKETESGANTIQTLWEAKLTIRDQMKKLFEKGELTSECSSALRDLLRSTRFVEDYIGRLVVHPTPYVKKKGIRPLSEKPIWLLKKPGLDKIEFKSGDILISRGDFSNSAAIARIGDQPGQFSHLSLVHVDDQTGKIETIEAHIEIGVHVFPFETWAKDGKARVAMYRNPDAELAKAAAQKIYDVVSKAESEGHPLPYNFSMDYHKRDSLFCTQVGEYGFDMGAKSMNRDFSMPLFKPGMNMKNLSFLNKLGIFWHDSFSPNDIELDPRFELLAEWRDFSRTQTLHQHDAIFTKIFSWVEKYDYEFAPSETTDFLKEIAYNGRRWPVFSELLKKTLPLNMSKPVLETVLQMHLASDKMVQHLEEMDKAIIAKRKYPMSEAELFEALEKFRKQDLKAYENHKAWEKANWNRPQDERAPEPSAAAFHRYFRPHGME